MGHQIPNYGVIVNESSIPQDNDTQTVLLGGNIQRQETDVNTNMEGIPSLPKQSESNVNWAESLSLGSSLIPLAAIGALYFLGKKK